MPSHVKGSRRKHSCLLLQFARRYSGESFYALTPSYLPIIWLLDRGVGEIEIVTLKIRGIPSRAVDMVLMGPDQV